jgi:ankyrin repeat protein
VTPLMLAPTLEIWNMLSGSHINRSDINGWTPLHYAVHHRRPQIVSTLLANGVDKNRLTHSGMTALDLATVKDFQELVTLLQA